MPVTVPAAEPSDSRYLEARSVLSRWLARVRCEVEGLERLPSTGPAIVVMNHTGWEEILVAIVTIPRPTRIVGMHDLVHLDDERSRARIFDTGYAAGMGVIQRRLLVALGQRYGARVRRLSRQFGYIPARVFSPTWQPVLGTNGIREIVRALDAGEVVLLFPEGGYRRNGVMTPFKRGIGLIVRLAQRRGIRVPIIPIAQHTGGCMTIALTNRFVPRMVIGSPMVLEMDGLTPEAFDAHAARHLQDRVNDLLHRAWPDAPRQTYATESGIGGQDSGLDQESGSGNHDNSSERVRAT
jgi:1-acyl-sn-glycerol-3-phosphate acyltransferase